MKKRIQEKEDFCVQPEDLSPSDYTSKSAQTFDELISAYREKNTPSGSVEFISILRWAGRMIHPLDENFGSLIEEGVALLVRFSRAEEAYLFRKSKSNGRLSCLASVVLSPAKFKKTITSETAGKLLKALQKKSVRTIASGDSTSHDEPASILSTLSKRIPGAYLAAPIYSEDTAEGFVLLINHEPKHAWPAETEEILEIFCHQLEGLFLRINSERLNKINEEKLRNTIIVERHLNELKSKFVSTASHDFRTPLAQILTAAESVKHYRSRMADIEIDQKLHWIGEQIKALNHHMDTLMLQSSRESNSLIYKPKAGDLVEFIRNVCQAITQTPEFNHLLNIQLPNTPIFCSFDKTILQSVISILISNAVNYSEPENLIDVRLSADGPTAVLTLRDRGIGIPEKEINKVFTTYYRASNLNNQRGLGLGLSLAKDAIALHNGKIEITSKLNAGTTVTVQLPILINHEENSDSRR